MIEFFLNCFKTNVKLIIKSENSKSRIACRNLCTKIWNRQIQASVHFEDYFFQIRIFIYERISENVRKHEFWQTVRKAAFWLKHSGLGQRPILTDASPQVRSEFVSGLTVATVRSVQVLTELVATRRVAAALINVCRKYNITSSTGRLQGSSRNA